MSEDKKEELLEEIRDQLETQNTKWDPVRGIFAVIAVSLGVSLAFLVVVLFLASFFGENAATVFWSLISVGFLYFLYYVFISPTGESFSYKKKGKLEGGVEFQFNTSILALKNFKEDPNSQMYTDLTIATNLYIKKYPQFVRKISEKDFKDYINWAIAETDNVFKDNPIKSKNQKESLIRLLNKLDKKIEKNDR